MTNRSRLLLAALLLSSQLFACSSPPPSANSEKPVTADATTNESIVHQQSVG
ncbi:hypothetical protein [Acaryochloris marina]|uniref:Lipoprotein n=1 Tax=Acaryochloris marina (strain MBIC 11017) TaxID=329726 RepID=A8ZKJ5_ACAM1|nr:hypothetical protein [Acaryochloris marina]ABW31694.1 hypothetical protein AM1_A0187 [Acaryochloris marina MBIC11017]